MSIGVTTRCPLCSAPNNRHFPGCAVPAYGAATAEPTGRTLAAITREIRADWKNVYFGAVPYLQAMASLCGMSDKYGEDSAKSVVLYFLSNATTWRGETARRVKKELNAMCKAHKGI